MVKLFNYVSIAHQILLILLALADLGAYLFLYLTLIKYVSLLKFRLRLFLSGLPGDLRRSAYGLYKSYMETSLSLVGFRNLLSLIQRG
ncbi:MAG: hypothetical protein LM561_03435 [Desulfurococcaceae archaeon]|nr:hypothetical protein [Desulfurococcaceae archaeon]